MPCDQNTLTTYSAEYIFEDGRKKPKNGLPFDLATGDGLDPQVFNGDFVLGSVSFQFLDKGSSVDYIRLGEATSFSMGDTTGVGVNIGVTAALDEKSSIVDGPYYFDCVCSN